jgi:hypothetical protein
MRIQVGVSGSYRPSLGALHPARSWRPAVMGKSRRHPSWRGLMGQSALATACMRTALHPPWRWRIKKHDSHAPYRRWGVQTTTRAKRLKAAFVPPCREETESQSEEREVRDGHPLWWGWHDQAAAATAKVGYRWFGPPIMGQKGRGTRDTGYQPIPNKLEEISLLVHGRDDGQCYCLLRCTSSKVPPPLINFHHRGECGSSTTMKKQSFSWNEKGAQSIREFWMSVKVPWPSGS